jgi:uncharacterized protein (DUF362 family)
LSKEIHVIYGNNPRKMTYDILEKYQLAKRLKPDMHIGIKPNLVVAKESSEGATTTPAIVEGIIQYLQAYGIKKISIMEGSWVGDSTKRAYEVCGYNELSRKYGVPLYDLKEDEFLIKNVNNLELKVCKKALEVDFLINVPVLKAHCQTYMTCCLKNLKGCIPDSEKRRFHKLGLNKPIGYLSKALRPGLSIVDGINGDLTFEEGGNPVQMDRIIVGDDPVLLDTYAASLLGYSKDDIEYIGIAEKMGVGDTDLENTSIYEYDLELKKGSRFKPSNQAKRLAEKVVAQDACSACYGSLIHALQRLSEQNMFKSIKEPIYIGQGYKGQQINGVGIGQCTNKLSKYLKGCPPTAKSIVDFLTDS